MSEDRFQNKYRIPSNRSRGWNYGCNANYFITIVTYGREHLFGKIVNGEMIMNDIGKIVYAEFFKSFMMREELFFGEFVLMPNHLHAIVALDNAKCDVVEMSQTFHRQSKSISSFVAGFKSAVIKHIDDWIDLNNVAMRKFNKNNPLWQANYYDHIIRNETEYRSISEYIINNPVKWEEDIMNKLIQTDRK